MYSELIISEYSLSVQIARLVESVQRTWSKAHTDSGHSRADVSHLREDCCDGTARNASTEDSGTHQDCV